MALAVYVLINQFNLLFFFSAKNQGIRTHHQINNKGKGSKELTKLTLASLPMLKFRLILNGIGF